MISVKNVTKRFGDRIAADTVSFEVQAGEIMGFLGPNGAGKTTTMRIITGFMPPTEGTVEVNGLDVFEHPYEVKKTIGYMPEHPPLYLDMTVKGYLNLAAELRGLRGNAVKKSVEKVMAKCGLSEVAHRLTGNLSKGYRQRVGLAQALVHEPEVLVLDEPTVGLDPKQIVEIRQLIKDLGREKTVILSTHILQEVTTVCESVTIINNGKIVASDNIENISRKFSRGIRIRIRVKYPEKLDLVMLKHIKGVDTAIVRDELIEVVIGKDDEVPLEEISGAINSMGAGLLEFRPVSLTLEEIFLRAVSGDVERGA